MRATRDAGLGIVLDIVPNHMAVDDANRYWADPELRRRFFDLDEATGRHRRFFDVDHLAGVRQEDERVFEETHRLALALVGEGAVDGLRIDHPDGLADPAGYLRRLRDGGARHVWVEKILDPGEQLRDWPVEGTVGYEFLNDVAALFVDPAGEAPLTALWEEVSGDERRFGELAFEAKLEQVRTTFQPEVERLRREAPRELGGLERTLASLPVYRTYVEPWSGKVEDADREAIAEAGLPESLARVLLLQERGWDAFVTRFQQTTPPVMAKGVEDTAFYRYARLLALNDVGGDPGRFGIGVDAFHAANAIRAERFPRGLLVTQTHDTKRSGDVRARIGALASMPDAWCERVRRWLALTGGPRARRRAGPTRSATSSSRRWWGRGRSSPSASPPTWRRRCARPSARRAGSTPTRSGRRACRRSAPACTSTPAFRADFEPFAAEVARAGDRMALGQLLLKLTVPGDPRRLPGRRAALAVAGRPRQPAAGRLGAPARAARRAAARRGADRRDAEAVADRARAGAAPPARGGVRGRLRAAGGRRRGVRVRARRRRARRHGGARRPRRRDRGRAGRALARRARRRRARAGRRRPGRGAARRARDRAARARLTS